MLRENYLHFHQAVESAFSPKRHDIVLSCGQDISLTQSETGLTLDTRALVTDALALEAPAQLSLAPYLHWDEASIRRSLERLNQQLGESHLETFRCHTKWCMRLFCPCCKCIPESRSS